MQNLSKRQFMAAIGAGVGLAFDGFAQEPSVVARKVEREPSPPNRPVSSRRAKTRRWR